MIIVPFSDDTSRESIQEAKKAGMSMAELRLDLCQTIDVDYARKLIKLFYGVPVLLTIRAKREGGKWEGSDRERLDLYRELMPDIQAVDVELSSGIVSQVADSAEEHGKTMIKSYHNFVATPGLAQLEDLAEQAAPYDNTIFKLATHIDRAQDLYVLTRFMLDSRDKKLIVIGMGAVAGRLMPPLYGSLATYASFSTTTAPGQISIEETAKLSEVLGQGLKR
jgi:3-dehydroquinate dehydratase I